jgi:hypothetical protein
LSPRGCSSMQQIHRASCNSPKDLRIRSAVGQKSAVTAEGKPLETGATDTSAHGGKPLRLDVLFPQPPRLRSRVLQAPQDPFVADPLLSPPVAIAEPALVLEHQRMGLDIVSGVEGSLQTGKELVLSCLLPSGVGHGMGMHVDVMEWIRVVPCHELGGPHRHIDRRRKR